MGARRRYRRKADQIVTAVQVQLDLEAGRFSYHKWGGEQRCKRGDWIVDNDGDIYTIDQKVFERTYRPKSPGRYEKVAKVWAGVAAGPGSVPTREGRSHFEAGDYIVSNDETGDDSYCMSAEKFQALYELDD